MFLWCPICFLDSSPAFCVQDDSPPLTFPYSQRMQTDPPAGVSASPVADNVMTWYVSFSVSFEALDNGLMNCQECRHYRPRRHAVRRWHIPPGHELRRTIPQQAPGCEIHKPNVPSQCVWNWRALSRYSAEPVESDI